MVGNAKKNKGITGQSQGVVLINVKDNKTLKFASLSACANFFKGPPARVDQLFFFIKKKVGLGYKTAVMTLVYRIASGVEYKGYIVKRNEDDSSEITQHRAKAISLTNTETGEVKVFGSLLEAEDRSGICRARLRKYAGTNEAYKGLVISYIDKKDN